MMYSNKKMIKKMQRENKLEEIGNSFSKAVPYVLGAVVGTALITGIAFYSSKMIKPETDKAFYNLEQKLDYEDRLNNFLMESHRR